MKAHMDKARSQLGELGSLQAKTEQTERNILAAAEKRLDEVQALIKRASTGIESAQEPEQQRYQDLVAERGQLNIVIAKAKKELGL